MCSKEDVHWLGGGRTHNRLNTAMKPQHYQRFAQLCEGILQEATTLSTILPGNPAANKLIANLHRGRQLAHDQQYQPTDNISWSAINDTSRGAWVIIQFASGVGAIKALNNKNGYEAVAVPSESLEVAAAEFTKGGDVINFFKQQGLGKIQQLFVGRDTGSRAAKDERRMKNKLSQEKAATMDSDRLLMKFQPLWVKAITAAMADIKGMAVTMIQNDAIRKAEAKLNRLSDLQRILDAIESGEMAGALASGGRNTRSEYLKKLVNNSIILTAAHYYPEETGDITRNYGGLGTSRYGGSSQVLKDIAAGDQKKLSAVLAFFKRQLISG